MMDEETDFLPSPSKKVDVRVLVSFFVSEHGGKTSTQAIHKEKFNIPMDESHKELPAFMKHISVFTDLKQIALSKGLGQNPEVTLARVNKNANGGVDVYSIRTQDAWKHEYPSLINDIYGNGMLQGRDSLHNQFVVFCCAYLKNHLQTK